MQNDVVCSICGDDHYTEYHYNWCPECKESHDPRSCTKAYRFDWAAASTYWVSGMGFATWETELVPDTYV